MALGWSAALPAQVRPVVWTAAPVSARAVTPGETVTIRLSAAMDQGWHVYSITQGPGGPIPTRIAVAAGQPFALIDVVQGPRPMTKFDQNFGITVETYDANPTFTMRVRVAPTAKMGTDTLAITARFQACTESLCLPPRTERIAVPLTVGGAVKGGRTTSASEHPAE